MSDPELSAALGRFSLGTLCSANVRVRAMDASITPLFQGAKICGPAKTAMTAPDQNAAIHRAVHTARPGDVLVIDGGGGCSFGLFGDILAAACARQGIQGVVVDGAVRDTADIRKMRFPVFCRGIHAAGAGKSDPGRVDTDIACGGVQVHPGDFIVADDDGVIVVPGNIAPHAVRNAKAIARKECEIKRRIANGETTCDIFGIAP